MYSQQRLSSASKGSYSYLFQFAAGTFGWSFETVGYLAYLSFFAILIILQLGYLISIISVIRATFLALILPSKDDDL